MDDIIAVEESTQSIKEIFETNDVTILDLTYDQICVKGKYSFYRDRFLQFQEDKRELYKKKYWLS